MSDYRTLDEIKKSDDDNFDHILGDCTDKIFPSQVYAYEYRMHCVERALQTLGFSPQELILSCTTGDTAAELIDQAMVSRNIHIEDWSEHKESKRRGMAIYKENEIVYFIALVHSSAGDFIVKSNVTFN